MDRFQPISFLLKTTTLVVALSTVAIPAQANGVFEQFPSRVTQLNQGELEQNTLDETDEAAPEATPLETIPNTPDSGNTLPNPLEPVPTDPTFGVEGDNPDSNEPLPQTPATLAPSINNGVIPDNTPAPIQPLNNVPNNNVPNPRQNVPNRSIDTTPNSDVPYQNVPNQGVSY